MLLLVPPLNHQFKRKRNRANSGNPIKSSIFRVLLKLLFHREECLNIKTNPRSNGTDQSNELNREQLEEYNVFYQTPSIKLTRYQGRVIFYI